MKQFFTLCAGLLLCMQTIAALRTQEEAMRIAAALGTDNQVTRIPARQPKTLTHCFTAKQKSGQPAFYVFNRGEEDGFILISAEDRTRTVLGYSDEGHWDETNMSPATRAWMDIYCQSISRVASDPNYSSEAPISRTPQKQKQQYTPIAPLCQTQWGQGNPYYLKCPTYNGERCVTGCVATAAAQIMKVHSYPTRGTGTYSYKWKSDTGDSITLSVNPGNTTYNWSQMLNTYTASATNTQKDAVATLMYHCGVVCEMSYTPTGSSASNNYMLAGMVNHFGYDRGVQVLIKDCIHDSAFVAGIASELAQGRPVMFSARTVRDEGHAFVGDGIDANGLIHINWGWNGTCDGYFQVSAMDPDNQGTGGSVSNEAYTEEVYAYTHIRPNANGSYHYTVMCDKVSPYMTSVDRWMGWVALEAEVYKNLSLVTLYGTSALKVYDANGDFLTYCDFEYGYNDLPPGYYYYSQYVLGDVSNLPVGDYYISPAVKVDGEYVPVLVKGYADYRCPMRITQDSIFLTEPTPETPDKKALNAYDYKIIDAYLDPNETFSSHGWRIQLATEDFYETDAEDQMMMLFVVSSASPVSFAGTFTNDTSTVYRLRAAYGYRGNINSYEYVAIDEAEVTVAYNSVKDSYTVYYHVYSNGKGYIGQAEVDASDVWAKYRNDYQSHAKYDQITLNTTHYTGITVSQAMSKINAQDIGWTSEIPYIVEGKIEQLINTPAQMLQYGNCRLYLSDGKNSIYGYNTKWINNQSYQTGSEIAVGGVAAIIGKLKYYNASTKEIESGYFYHYAAPGTIREYGLMTDAESADYNESFDNYNCTIYSLSSDDYYALVTATQNDAYVKLYIFLPSAESTLTIGTYPFADDLLPITAYSGCGVDEEGYIQGSYAGYKSSDGYITIPVWYPRNGSVSVSADGTIIVNATNSFGRTIDCRLKVPVNFDIEQTEDEGKAIEKIVRNGQVFILRNGNTYTVQGVKVND